MTVLMDTAWVVVGTCAQFTPLTKNANTSLNIEWTHSLYSSEPNT